MPDVERVSARGDNGRPSTETPICRFSGDEVIGGGKDIRGVSMRVGNSHLPVGFQIYKAQHA